MDQIEDSVEEIEITEVKEEVEPEPGCDDNEDCPDYMICCNRECIDARFDPENCGSCGVTCKEDENCCDGQCTPKTDPDNCGVCGHVCPEPEAIPFSEVWAEYNVCGTPICDGEFCGFELSSRTCPPGSFCLEDGLCHYPCNEDWDCPQPNRCVSYVYCEDGYCRYGDPLDCSRDDLIETDYYITCTNRGASAYVDGDAVTIMDYCKYYPRFYVPYPDNPDLVREPFGRYSTQVILRAQDRYGPSVVYLLGDKMSANVFPSRDGFVDANYSFSVTYSEGIWHIDGRTTFYYADFPMEVEAEVHLTTNNWLVFYGNAVTREGGRLTGENLGPFCAVFPDSESLWVLIDPPTCPFTL